VAIGAVLATLAAIIYLCAFHIVDVDVWWHIAAGRWMRATHGLISIEPFAYTRAGEPYLATHEWLAQVILAAVFDAFGARGIIVLRTVLVAAALLPVVAFAKRRAWLTAPLAMFAVLALRPAILDRPQLFTFVAFSAIISLSLLWAAERVSSRAFVMTAAVVQVLWVNLHGAAALMSLLVVGAMLCDRAVTLMRRGDPPRTWTRDGGMRTLALALGLLTAATFASPNTVHTLTYLQSLLTDQTAQLIDEWRPSTGSTYLTWIAPFWVVATAAVVIGRRHVVAAVVLLGGVGWLSLQATRHEPLFVLAASIVTADQLASDRWQRLLARLAPRVSVCAAATALAIAALGWKTVAEKQLFAGRSGLGGFGAYEPLKAAADFLERERVSGKIFNTYEAGNYLIFRGAQGGKMTRPVFIDGRNVDHGVDFFRATLKAAADEGAFRALEAQFGFTVAVVAFEPFAHLHPLPYAAMLDGLSDWVLVEIDDAAAVYVKRDQLHEQIGLRSGYRVLRPEVLVRPGQAIAQLPRSDAEALERELIRAERDQPSMLRPRLARATLYLRAGALAEAESLAGAVRSEAPWRHEAYSILGLVRAAQQRYAEAGELIEESIRRAGGEGATELDAGFVADIFEKAGNAQKAQHYRSLLSAR
jgi:hypothetical protein